LCWVLLCRRLLSYFFFLLCKFYLFQTTNQFTNSLRGNIFNYAFNLDVDGTVTDSRYCWSLYKTTIR
jgi:hypothetical protein